MQNEVHAVAGRSDRLVIGDIGLAEIKAVNNAGKVGNASVRKIVDSANLVAAGNQRMGDIRSNEAGHAGDQIFGHGQEDSKSITSSASQPEPECGAPSWEKPKGAWQHERLSYLLFPRPWGLQFRQTAR